VSSLWLALFWVSVATVFYAYLGYPLLLAALTRRAPLSPDNDDLPTVDVLIAAYNEAGCILEKLHNTLALDYPTERLSITVVADGSTDATPELVRGLREKRVHLIYQPEREGKGAALTRALPYLNGEVVLFTDANCLLSPDTARLVVRHFADSRVGGVSGAKRIRTRGLDPVGEGIYWRYESWVKELDGRFGSVMGAPGEIWAARREAYEAPPADIVLEDFYASMDIVARGWRVAYEPAALSFEESSPSLSAEFERRSRNAAGGFQAVRRLQQVWRSGPRTVFQYVSHRILRWVVVPPMLALLPLWTLFLLPRPFFSVCLALEAAFAVAALLGWAGSARRQSAGWLAPPFGVALLNASALAGALRYLRGQTTVLWRRVRP
jgi:biofilm PGA synthesis N-glycosyltransferase PgaC